VCPEASPPPALGRHPIYERSLRERRGDQRALACALLTTLREEKKIFKKIIKNVKKKNVAQK
jgi:hypothetical protein